LWHSVYEVFPAIYFVAIDERYPNVVKIRSLSFPGKWQGQMTRTTSGEANTSNLPAKIQAFSRT
jgi:hypothetical protein